MTRSAAHLLSDTRKELAPRPEENQLISKIEDGSASLQLLGELAAQETRILVSTRRSLLVLAARGSDDLTGPLFTSLAAGEGQALRMLAPLRAACGLLDSDGYARPALAGCQALSGYLAWLALNGDPGGVVLALFGNTSFASYCATTAAALTEHYGFDEQACAFFKFFAESNAELEAHAAAVLEDWTARNPTVASDVLDYGRLQKCYELMFWNTLSDLDS
ncbi:transcriptional regulator [Streptomyces sp. NPDC005529]|uniref:transcriptional regulator n=1 Tax=unclassified Streptomyces TaxID=2593676 RepID=UPI0033AC6B3F